VNTMPCNATYTVVNKEVGIAVRFLLGKWLHCLRFSWFSSVNPVDIELLSKYATAVSFQIFIYDSSVGIALGYGLDDRGSRVRFPVGAGNFSLHHRVQNSSGAHPASYPMGIRGSFRGGKAAGS
jgi:hypothetical protein